MSAALPTAPPPPDPVALVDGNLAGLTAFELLQVLQFLGKRGSLRLRSATGHEATCEVLPRGLTQLCCGPLRGREAALAFVWWKAGSFRFEAAAAPGGAAVDAGAVVAVQEILLEAVRLADEVEARGDVVPERLEPLTLLLRDPPRRELEQIAAVPEILRTLRQSLAPTRRDLEATLPFAPITVAFALARLCEEGFIGAARRDPVSAVPSPEPGVDGRADGLARVLVAFARARGDVVAALLAEISTRLGVPAPPGTVDLESPSFHRARLGSGRFLSITVVPVSRRNRFVFESLADSLDVVVFMADPQAGGEAREWREKASPATRIVTASAGRAAADETLAILGLDGGAVS